MTVLCLVERDGDGAADVSLRALTFARSLAGSGAGGLAAAVFGPGAPAELANTAWRTCTRSRPGTATRRKPGAAPWPGWPPS